MKNVWILEILGDNNVEEVEVDDDEEESTGRITLTVKEKDFQDLPPFPEEEVKSIVKLSHGPITEGSDIEITGEMGEVGAITEIFWTEFNLQLLQLGSEIEVHKDFNVPPTRVITSFTSIPEESPLE